jgi:hypothetical protein
VLRSGGQQQQQHEQQHASNAPPAPAAPVFSKPPPPVRTGVAAPPSTPAREATGAMSLPKAPPPTPVRDPRPPPVQEEYTAGDASPVDGDQADDEEDNVTAEVNSSDAVATDDAALPEFDRKVLEEGLERSDFTIFTHDLKKTCG